MPFTLEAVGYFDSVHKVMLVLGLVVVVTVLVVARITLVRRRSHKSDRHSR